MRLAVVLATFTLASASPRLDARQDFPDPVPDRCGDIGYPCPNTGDAYCCEDYLGYIICPSTGEGYGYYPCPSGMGCQDGPDGPDGGDAFCQAI